MADGTDPTLIKIRSGRRQRASGVGLSHL